MRILAVSDEECASLWDYYMPGKLDGYDLILSCGDLKASYLTFLVTMGRARLLYVPGNHDVTYPSQPPEGCECIDDQLVVFNGIRILGLGGCLWYHPGPYQYTEREMRARIRKVSRAVRKAGGVDIVITHAPPRGLGDLDDPAHRGFECLRELIDAWHPKYLLHGHTHLRYGIHVPRETVYGDTRIINVTERYVLDYSDAPADQNDLIYLTRQKKKTTIEDSYV